MPPPEIREKILDTASRLFAARGYEAVSMRCIAAAAGMTPANLYHHFRDKEDLIRSSLAQVFRGKAQAFEAILQGEADPEQRLAQSVGWLVGLLFEDAIFAKLFFRELLAGEGSRLRFLTESVFQGPFSATVRLMGQALGMKDAVRATFLLTGAIIGCFQYSRIFQFLREAKAEPIDPQSIARGIVAELHRQAGLRGEEAAACLVAAADRTGRGRDRLED